MPIFQNHSNGLRVLPVFQPFLTVLGDFTHSDAINSNYIKVLYHYYNKWYDYCYDFITGNILTWSELSYIILDDHINNTLIGWRPITSKNVPCTNAYVPLYDFTWEEEGDIIDKTAESRVMPNTTVFKCHKHPGLKHYPEIFTPVVTNRVLTGYRNGMSQRAMTRTRNMDALKQTPLPTIPTSTKGMTGPLVIPLFANRLHHPKATASNGLVSTGNAHLLMATPRALAWKDAEVNFLCQMSHLNVIAHTINMKKGYLDMAYDFCKRSLADFVEIFPDKIYIHTRNCSMQDLFFHKFWSGSANVLPPLPGRKTYVAESVPGSPVMKLTRFKRK